MGSILKSTIAHLLFWQLASESDRLAPDDGWRNIPDYAHHKFRSFATDPTGCPLNSSHKYSGKADLALKG